MLAYADNNVFFLYTIWCRLPIATLYFYLENEIYEIKNPVIGINAWKRF